jgi:hypothetical protein
MMKSPALQHSNTASTIRVEATSKLQQEVEGYQHVLPALSPSWTLQRKEQMTNVLVTWS